MIDKKNDITNNNENLLVTCWIKQTNKVKKNKASKLVSFLRNVITAISVCISGHESSANINTIIMRIA